MGWRDSPAVPVTKVLVTTNTISLYDIFNYGHFVADTTSAAVALTLASPALACEGWELMVTNDGAASNDITITCTNGFMNDMDIVTVGDKDTVHLICCRDAGGDFRWLSPDATPTTA